jgi:hypothetical protein
MQGEGDQVDQHLSVGSRVRVRTGSDRESPGVIADDYGETSGIPIELGPNRVIDPARRWAVVGDDGTLMFADSHQITFDETKIASAETSPSPGDAEPGESSDLAAAE